MKKHLKLIHNVLQFFICNSTRCHYLEPLKKGFMAKMAHLAEFWLILESDLVENPHMKYLLNKSETITHNTKYCTVTNTFSFTEFGSIRKTL